MPSKLLWLMQQVQTHQVVTRLRCGFKCGAMNMYAAVGELGLCFMSAC